MLRTSRPYPYGQMDKIFANYKGAKIRWVQEEPENMGGWQYLNSIWRDADIEVISRPLKASPATGFKKVHEKQQAAVVDQAFA